MAGSRIDENIALGIGRDAPDFAEVDVVRQAERIGDGVSTGTVFMNRCDYVDPSLAWTGVKDTGRGASMSRLGFEALTRPKSFHLRIEH